MIDNLAQAMDRVASIRATLGVDAGRPPASAAGGAATPMMMQQVLAQAMAHASQPVGAVPAGGLTPLAGPVRNGPPPGLEGYHNGRIPPQVLVPIGGTSERLWAPAAAAFEHMRRDAARAGVSLPVIDAYRSHDDQVRLAAELGLYRDGGWAAVPGTSQHGWGRAVDLDLDDRALAWLRANAWKYGFVEAVPREPWHWEFHPAA